MSSGRCLFFELTALLVLAIALLPGPVLATTYAYLDGQSFLETTVPDTIDATADCSQPGNQVSVELWVDVNQNGVVDGGEFQVQFVVLNDGIPSLMNDQGDEIPGDDDAQANGLL